MRTRLDRTRADLDYFVHAIRHPDPSARLLDYAAATEVVRNDRVDCNAVIDAMANGSAGAVTHDPLPAIRGDEKQLRVLFTRLLVNGSGLRPAHVTAGYQGEGWTFCIRYQDAHAPHDPVAARIVEAHDGTLAVEQSSARATVRIHIPRRPR